MDKIDCYKFRHLSKGSKEELTLDKINELVKENSKLRMRIGRLEDIVKYHIEKQ